MSEQSLVARDRYCLLYLVTQGISGGPHTHINDLASRLSTKFEVHVAIGADGNKDKYLDNKSLPTYQISSLVRSVSAIHDLKAFKEIVELLKKIRPDFISTHSSKAGVLGRMAARYCGIPAIFTAHGWSFTEGIPESQRRIYLSIERAMAGLAERIICVSEYDRQLALRYHVGCPEKLVTIQNGVQDCPQTLLARPCEEEEPLNMVMVARFSEQKDHRLLLETLFSLATKKSFRLHLVGDGPLRRQCEELTFQLGLADRVRFWGDSMEVPQILAASHLFLLISKWEGLPRSILEAMRAGLPVIASDVGGVSEAVIDGETGFLVPRGDRKKLSEKIQLLIGNDSLRAQMGINGRRRFLERFTIERLLDETVTVYNDVIYRTKQEGYPVKDSFGRERAL